MASPKFTFAQFKAEYPDDAACLDAIMLMRNGGTEFVCPHCRKQSKFHRITKRRAYACQICGDHIYPCVGTVFEKSRTPLNKWFFAMYMFTSTRHGVAAKELERQLGITYKCAWRMAHELRKLMAMADMLPPNGGMLKGHVEADETYVGGKGEMKTRSDRKTTVLALIERGGRMRAWPIKSASAGTLTGAIELNVEEGARISTDELPAYTPLADMGFDHQTVNHSTKEWARGDVHVNSLEGHFGRFKNSVRGTHVHISRRHMWKYVAEFSYRNNMRKRPQFMFRQMVLAFSQQRLADD